MPNESDRFSLGEFSAFFNNDHSDGHRLAEFLQKKNGATQARRCVLADYDPGPMELDVQVIPLKNPASNCGNNEGSQRQSSKETYAEVNENIHHESRQQDSQLNTSRNHNNREQQPLATSPLPRAPLRLLPDIRRSGGTASPSDRLRRYSLKRLSVRKRSLLQELEFTTSPENFKPTVCSTPCNTSVGYLVRGSDGFEPSSRRQDDELTGIQKAVHDTNQEMCEEAMGSPRHTFTIQKGSENGQTVLTPKQNTWVVAASKISLQANDPLQVMIQKSPRPEINTSGIPCNNVNESLDEVYVPETQEQSKVHTSPSNNNKPSKSLLEKERSSPTGITSKEKSDVAENCAAIAHEQNMTDNSTDDDDEIDKTVRNVPSLNCSPLNLAASSKSTRLRKKRMRRTSVIEKAASSDTDTELVLNGEPVIATLRSATHPSLKRRILNKAPRTPINGEQFASELERLTNHEILDLRKRNSLHKVFPITKNNSLTAKQDALEKRQQLEEKIQTEIQKRHLNIQETTDIQDGGSSSSPSVTVLKNTRMGNSPPTSQIAAEDGHNSYSKANVSKRSTRSSRHKPMPEVVEYRALVEGVKLRKRSSMDQSTKRLLYTKGDSLCEDIQDETRPEVDLISRTLPKSGNSQSRTASPSKTVEARTLEMSISSRSPPASTTSNVGTVLRSPVLKDGEALLLAPPDPFLDQEKSLRDGDHEMPTDGEYEIPKGGEPTDRVEKPLDDVCAPVETLADHPPARETSETGLVLADPNSETIFKKPLKRAPKSSKKALNILSPSDESESGSLRRSKRGHVPLQTWSFQVRFQELLLRSSQNRNEKKKITSRMAHPIASSTVNSERSRELRKAKQVRVRLKRTKMPLVHESKRVCLTYEDNFDALSHNCQNISIQTDTTELPSYNNSKSVGIVQVLKRAQNKYESTNGTAKEFQEMHCTAANTLVFNDLEGIEYAFYDETATVGYLRFQPHQVKPPKRTSKYNLRFVIINGTFDIATNGESGEFTEGDMVCVNSGSLYKIQNTSNDVGILLVTKQ